MLPEACGASALRQGSSDNQTFAILMRLFSLQLTVRDTGSIGLFMFRLVLVRVKNSGEHNTSGVTMDYCLLLPPSRPCRFWGVVTLRY